MAKIQTKKLALHKETMRVLENSDLEKVAGGITGSVCGNPTCCALCNPDATIVASCNQSDGGTCTCWTTCTDIC
ncbi:hypothetical protein [Archangium lansingense]|uniref:Uncharacterized protein n=1 Tax=Archangium lansingense TaxID=2995310 RepID=A0ABT4A800_9BACT|nr:hypothetical protein [Archangium lansinium]MCY1077793.1 hypothetical protein [Archangium lansinium]